jgi:hypothetical protein
MSLCLGLIFHLIEKKRKGTLVSDEQLIMPTVSDTEFEPVHGEEQSPPEDIIEAIARMRTYCNEVLYGNRPMDRSAIARIDNALGYIERHLL